MHADIDESSTLLRIAVSDADSDADAGAMGDV
jgi:hypothetical protein